MPETNRTHYEVGHHMVCNGIDRYRGNSFQRMEMIVRGMESAQKIADLANQAYQKGREEMMEELAKLFGEEGGQFYINQMLLAAQGGIHSLAQVTVMVTERIDASSA